MESHATAKGQVTIPASVRRKLAIKNGTLIQVEVSGQTRQIILTPITREYIPTLRGKFSGADTVCNFAKSLA